MKEPIALVTGASRGLGREIAVLLVENGYRVYAGVRNIEKVPEGTIPVWVDLTNEESLQLCVNKLIEENGKIDVLVNNAGIAYFGGVDTMTIKEVRELFDVNFFGTFFLTQLFLPYMREQKKGKIFFISSVRGIESCAYMGMYSASKAALEAIAFDWAVTLSKWNIVVSVVQPGPLDTGIDIKHGTRFAFNENPYAPYGEYNLTLQSPKDAAKVILENILKLDPPFRFQTDDLSKRVVEKHSKDYSGVSWYLEQKQKVTN
jgi:NAD(P)-dependent dehydrogenase (short-subunit alcohol dehydrogenase family)